MENILILGVGNILYTDEGIGVKCVELLQEHYSFPENVTLSDGGTLGINLMKDLMAHERVYVLDAVLGTGQPGDVYRLTGEDLRKSLSFTDSMHGTDLVDTLLMCEIAGSRPETVVLGMEPFDYQTMSIELSEPVRNSLPKLVDALLAELRAIGLEPQPR